MSPFQRLIIDLQLRDQKVTSNQLFFSSVLRPNKALSFAHMDSFMPMRSVLARQVLSKSNQKLTQNSRTFSRWCYSDLGNDPIFDVSIFSQLDRSFMLERFAIG